MSGVGVLWVVVTPPLLWGLDVRMCGEGGGRGKLCSRWTERADGRDGRGRDMAQPAQHPGARVQQVGREPQGPPSPDPHGSPPPLAIPSPSSTVLFKLCYYYDDYRICTTHCWVLHSRKHACNVRAGGTLRVRRARACVLLQLRARCRARRRSGAPDALEPRHNGDGAAELVVGRAAQQRRAVLGLDDAEQGGRCRAQRG